MSGGQINDPVKDAVTGILTAVIVLTVAAILLAPAAWLIVRLWRWALGA